MPASDVVLDASVAVRAIADEHPEAADWFIRIGAGEVRASWPELAYVEIANGLSRLVRAGRIEAEAAAAGLASVLGAPIRAAPLSLLAQPAFGLAIEGTLSAYDACYVVLAEATQATVVTSDRRLAEAARRAILIAA